MASDYITEQKEEEEHRETVRIELMREAAIHIIDGMPESSAMAHVEEVHALRMEAEVSDSCIRDEEGFVESYLESELEPPSTEGKNPKQIYAIQQKLLQNS
ncbi:MAG: hypothetical protein H9917_00190 [Candidatus Oceanisphaera merdipullorum]|nr:hypothetical protein [Candidatus Oceanisphaera merdipullorum]